MQRRDQLSSKREYWQEAHLISLLSELDDLELLTQELMRFGFLFERLLSGNKRGS